MGSIQVQRKDDKLFILIMKCLDEINIYRKLHFAYFLTFSISDPLAEKYEVEKFQETIKDILLDEKLVRVIQKREAIIMEDGNIYFGKEYLESPYNYNKELEKTILTIDFNITGFLASIMNELDIPKGFNLDTI